MGEIIRKNSNKPMPDVFIAMLNYASTVEIIKIKKSLHTKNNSEVF